MSCLAWKQSRWALGLSTSAEILEGFAEFVRSNFLELRQIVAVVGSYDCVDRSLVVVCQLGGRHQTWAADGVEWNRWWRALALLKWAEEGVVVEAGSPCEEEARRLEGAAASCREETQDLGEGAAGADLAACVACEGSQVAA